MNDRKTTSLKVDPQLWKDVKKHCIDRGIDISDFIEEIVRKELQKKK